jgi:16S rRNA (cytosine967-C5)-methyltransferase
MYRISANIISRRARREKLIECSIFSRSCSMSRWHSYLHSAVQILESYKGDEPFASFLRKFFSANKKYGSTDRKQVTHLCYCFFRLGKAVNDLPLEDRILLGLFLCSHEKEPMLQDMRPEWNEQVEISSPGKWQIATSAYPSFSPADVFPWKNELTDGIDYEKFCASFFIQPDLYLRLRPRKKETVIQKLQQANIPFQLIGDHCLAVANASKIDQVILLNSEAVVQDLNSQRTGELMKMAFDDGQKKVWDCCAASGGKSIMAYDIDRSVSLTVSDVRESILVNLGKRFEAAGIQKYRSLVFDLSSTSPATGDQYTMIIADVPCSGSGTWSRTPEQLYYFDEKKIGAYSSLQKKIVSNAISALQPGGYFLYITCSVFAKENEENVAYLQQNAGLKLVKMEILEGYGKRADTLFVALLRK